MAQRRHHYERAFEAFLRSRRIPYVAVDEAKKALVPSGAGGWVGGWAGAESGAGAGVDGGVEGSLKSFDFVIYGETTNLLVDVKGRRVGSRGRGVAGVGGVGGVGRLESWVTREDVESLRRWQGLFGPGFEPAFVFIYWCEEQPPDALFQEIFEYQGAWYALRAVTLGEYVAEMKPRSERWRTVHVPTRAFERISRPFAPVGGGGGWRGGGSEGLWDMGPRVPVL